VKKDGGVKILYATDGSECAAVAGRLLARLPLSADTRVTVLSAIAASNWTATLPLEGSPGTEGCLYSTMAELAAEEKAAACETARNAAARLRERGAAVDARVRRQSPAQAILEQAEADGTDLIVVGSHGKGAMERLLIGSVSECVARYSHCSVLVARRESLRRAIVAVDGSESAECALAAFVRLPLPTELELIVMPVLRPGTALPALETELASGETAAVAAHSAPPHAGGPHVVRRAQDHLRSAGWESVTDLRCGAPAEELVTAARETRADLIIVGAANRSMLGHLFLGSVSSRVLSHAPCSVLIAR
jgi:nucleotide-binding universal stress UspA family protein